MVFHRRIIGHRDSLSEHRSYGRLAKKMEKTHFGCYSKSRSIGNLDDTQPLGNYTWALLWVSKPPVQNALRLETWKSLRWRPFGLSTGDGLVSFSSIPPYVIRFVAETNFMKKESMFRLLVQRKETLTTMIISKRPARMKISLERIAEIVCY